MNLINADSLSSDSANAANAKAALRGAKIMQTDRDTLRLAKGFRPSQVVDTFAMAPAHDQAFSPVSKEDFDAARKRISQAEEDLDKAAKALAKASESGQYSDASLEVIARRISTQTEHIATLTARLDAIEKDWKVDRMPVATSPAKGAKPQPGTGTGKGVVKQPDAGSGKGAVKQSEAGSGKGDLKQPESSTVPK